MERGPFHATGVNPLHREDVIEENAEESLPHEDFYSAGHSQPKIVTHPLVSTKYTPMPVFPSPPTRACLDITSFVICLITMIGQFALLDYYYLSVLKDNVWFAWVGADSLVIVVFLWLFVVAVKNNQDAMEEAYSLDAKVKLAWIAWFLYSLVIVAKIATCFRLFYDQLPAGPMDNNDKLFDDHLLKMALCLSVFVFIFLLEAHHYTPLASPRQLYLAYLVTAITLDLLDTVAILDLLFQAFVYKWNLPYWLDLVILCLGCTNIILPTFALLKLRFNKSQRVLLISEKVWAFFYVFLVNGPFLAIRIYLYILLEVQAKGNRYEPSIFAVKNVAVMYIALRELWTRLQYWRQKRGGSASRGELTAQEQAN